MVHFADRDCRISQENQVGYDGGGGAIIFIVWIKFAAFEKHFSFVSLAVIRGSC